MTRAGPFPRWLWDPATQGCLLLRADGTLAEEGGPGDPPKPTTAELAESALLAHCLPQMPMAPAVDHGIPQPDLTGTAFDPISKRRP